MARITLRTGSDVIPNSCGGYGSHPGGIFGLCTRPGVTPDARRGFTVPPTGPVTARTDAAVDAPADRALCWLSSPGENRGL